MGTRYTKEELEEYLFEALAMFNDALESDLTSENVVLDFFTPTNGLLYAFVCLIDLPHNNDYNIKKQRHRKLN